MELLNGSAILGRDFFSLMNNKRGGATRRKERETALSCDSPISPPYRCIVFDLDGTLLDTLEGMLAAINTALARLGRPAARPELLREAVHEGMTAMLDAALRDTGPPPSEAERGDACRWMYLAYRRHAAAGAMVYPGAAQLVEALRQAGVHLAVCTNQFEGNARRLLHAKRLLQAFDQVLGRDSLPRFKPDPTPLSRAMQAAGVGPRETLMVGDSAVDTACAAAAGVDVVLMAHGYGIDRAPAAPPRAPGFDTLRRWLTI